MTGTSWGDGRPSGASNTLGGVGGDSREAAAGGLGQETVRIWSQVGERQREGTKPLDGFRTGKGR